MPTAPPNFDCEVICANGTLRFSEHGEKYVKIGKGDKWDDVPFDDPPAPMHHEWNGFAEAIRQGLESPASGEWGRHIMEILFAAEESSVTGREVVLASGPGWFHQSSGTPVTTKHGWI